MHLWGYRLRKMGNFTLQNIKENEVLSAVNL